MFIVLYTCLFPSIPLVPRRPKSGEPGTGKGKDKKGDKKKDKTADADKPDTPVPPADPDEKVSKPTGTTSLHSNNALQNSTTLK